MKITLQSLSLNELIALCECYAQHLLVHAQTDVYDYEIRKKYLAVKIE